MLPLLITKLHSPPARPDEIARPRLVERLNTLYQRRLALISAPAGFGKTTLLVDWMQRSGQGESFAWLSLDEGDNDPARFCAYLVAALQTVRPGLGVGVQALLASPQAAQLASPEVMAGLALTPILNELAEYAGELVLIVDDIHRVENSSIYAALAFLVEHLPGGMHVALGTRVDPPLPLARWRARGELVELRAADLRFSAAETGEFFQHSLGLPVTPQEIEALHARAEGWAAGLRLAALAMESLAREMEQEPADSPSALSAFVQAFSGSNQYILDYLVEEVLAFQPQAIQDFLMRTSILERLNAELCDALLGGGQLTTLDDGNTATAHRSSSGILEFLDHHNLFLVPLDREGRWYRYHHLFAELLMHRLDRLGGEQVPALHARAAAWLEAHGDLEAAVGHWLKAGDLPNTARLVETHAFQMLERGRLALLISWFSRLPEEIVRERPWLCVHHAWALALVGQPEAAEARLQAAETGRARMDDGGQSALQGHMDAIQAYTAALQNDSERAIRLARAALETLPPGDVSVRGLVAFTLGGVSYLSGDLEDAGRAFVQAAEMGQAGGNLHLALPALRAWAGVQALQGKLRDAAQTYRDTLQWMESLLGGAGLDLPITASAHTGLGELFFEWNNLKAAIPELERGVRLAESWGNAPAQVSSLLSLAYARLAQGQAEVVEALLQQCETISRSHAVTPSVESSLAAARLRWSLRQGDLAAARRLAEARGLADKRLEEAGEWPFWREAEYLAAARLSLAENDPDQTLVRLERLQARAEASGRVGSLVAIYPVKSLALEALQRHPEAVQVLHQALELAQPEGFVRTFLDCSPVLIPLLREIQLRARTASLLPYLQQLLAAFEREHEEHTGGTALPPGAAPWQPEGTVEPLSERELEVLRLVAAGLSNAAIARRLVISLGTVKAHTYSIYQKLGVGSRTQAAALARELNLL